MPKMSETPAAPKAPARAALSRGAEIRLVAARELRAQLVKKSSLIATAVLLVIAVVGILAYGHFTRGRDAPYRLGVLAADAATATALAPALEQVRGSNNVPVEVVDLSGEEAAAALGAAGSSSTTPRTTRTPEARADMVLDLTADSPRLLVSESRKADTAVVTAVTGILQQAALSDQIAALGGDPSAAAEALNRAAPRVVALDPLQHDAEEFGARYTILAFIDILLMIAIMGGGQAIAMGVVEEKASRIVEILLACVRPTSLLAGKVLGTGTAVILSYGLIGVVAAATAELAGVLPQTSIRIDAVVVAMIVWMIVGYAIAAAAYGAAGSLVSRQEDAASVTVPLTAILMVPYMLSFVMVTDPARPVFRVLAYLPPFSPFLMPARLVLGVSGWVEQLVALALALAFIPLLVRLAATVYTRAVTRTGSRVPLREVLARRAA